MKLRATTRVNAFNGFTLIELLVVITIISILAALLLPVLSKVKQKGQGIYCLNNGRQLLVAMTIYATENSELFPPNPDDGNAIPGHNWCSGSAGIGGSAEFNPDILRDPQRSLLSPFLAQSTSAFHCPADKRQGAYQGSDPSMTGRTVSAARTFSMNQAVGTICPGYDSATGHAGKPSLSVNGPWLNGQRTHRRNSPWATYNKFSSIQTPGPSMLWILVDEAAGNLNDASFAFSMEKQIWVDVPGQYHNGGCGFAFADGHSENRKWLFRGVRKGRLSAITASQDKQDWTWMKDRTSHDTTSRLSP